MLRKIAQNLGWFFKHYKKEYTIGITLMLLSYSFTLIPPWAVGYITDRIAMQNIELNELFMLISVLIALVGISYTINYIWNVLIFKANDVICRETRRQLVRKFLTQSPIFFAKNTTGSLMGKATNDVQATAELSAFGIMAFSDATIYPIATIVIMAITVDWRLTLVSILPLPLLFFCSKKVGALLYRRYDEAQEAFDQMNDDVLENIAGVRVIRAFGMERQSVGRFAGTTKELYDKNMAVVRLNALFAPMSRIIPGFSYLIALVYGARLMEQGTLTTGQIVSFIFYLGMLTWPMFALGDFMNVAQQGTASAERISELKTYQEDLVDRPDAKTYTGGGAIRFDAFNFSYPDQKGAGLNDIRFELKHGQTLGIVGKVGSGKTTLIKQLLRFYPVADETLFIGELPVEAYTAASLRDHIGYVPQQHMLFSRTIEENIRLGHGPNPDSDLSIDEAIELADFTKDLAQLPDGLKTMVGEKGIALSGGQKQRVSLARALLKNPDILILDDSLSAVDATTESNILSAIRRTRSGKTTLISAHRLSGVMHADLIIVLDQGRISSSGRHDQLLQEGGWYKEQFMRQQLEQQSEETPSERQSVLPGEWLTVRE